MSINEIHAKTAIRHEIFVLSVGDMVTDIINTFVLSSLHEE